MEAAVVVVADADSEIWAVVDDNVAVLVVAGNVAATVADRAERAAGNIETRFFLVVAVLVFAVLVSADAEERFYEEEKTRCAVATWVSLSMAEGPRHRLEFSSFSKRKNRVRKKFARQ